MGLEKFSTVKCIIRAREMHTRGELLSLDIKNAFNSVPFEAII
jgi:hypothetical protein